MNNRGQTPFSQQAIFLDSIVAKALKSPQTTKSLGEFIVSDSTGDEFKTYIKQESDKYKYGRLIKAANTNIKLEN